MLLHTAGHTCGRLSTPTSTAVGARKHCRQTARQSLSCLQILTQMFSVRRPIDLLIHVCRDHAVLSVADHHCYTRTVGSSAQNRCRLVQTVSTIPEFHSYLRLKTVLGLQQGLKNCTVLQPQEHQQNQLLVQESRILESRTLGQTTGT